MLYIVIPVALVVAYLVFTVCRTANYYSKILNKKHYAEVVNWLQCVLKLGSIDEPRPEDNTAFETSGRCLLTFTREIGEKDTIHIAMSQTTRPTDHGVCNRLTFLIAEALKPNNASSDFYHTEGKIHHLLFAKDVGGEWLTNETDAVVAKMKSYEPPPARFQAMDASP